MILLFLGFDKVVDPTNNYKLFIIIYYIDMIDMHMYSYMIKLCPYASFIISGLRDLYHALQLRSKA